MLYQSLNSLSCLAVKGDPKYLAFYELANVGALRTWAFVASGYTTVYEFIATAVPESAE